MTRIAVFNQKGGVGKTTTVLNLGAALHIKKHKLLMLDMDPQAHLTQIHQSLSTNNKNLFSFYKDNVPLHQLKQEWKNIGHIVPSHQELIKVDSLFGKGPSILNRLKQGLDIYEKESSASHTIIDCCPYLGVLSLNAVFAADLVIVPIASDYLSLNSAKKVDNMLRALEPVLKKRVNRRYLLTNYDKRRRMTGDIEKMARDLYKDEVLKTVISESVAVAESPQFNQDVISYASTSKGAYDYMELLNELIKTDLIKPTSSQLQ